MYNYIRVDKNHPCPICHHTDWCRLAFWEDAKSHEYIPVAICNRVPSDIECKDNGGGYVHFLADKSESYKYINKNKEEIDERLPLPVRSMIYNELLDNLSLSDNDREKFVNERGFNEEVLDYLKYRTLDRKKVKDIARQLYHKFGDLIGLPGAYTQNGVWTIGGYDKSVLLPVRELDYNIYYPGHINAIVTRLPKIINGNKYVCLSSKGKPNGTPSGAYAHISVPLDIRRNDVIGITEGIIKADYWANKMGIIVIAVPGVSTWKTAIPVIQEMIEKLNRLSGVIVAFDADKYINHFVMDYENKLVNELVNLLPVALAEWDISQGKGIDDLLSNGYEPKYKVINKEDKKWRRSQMIGKTDKKTPARTAAAY